MRKIPYWGKIPSMPVSPALIRAARVMLGWSQTVLARKAGVSRATVAKYEIGRSTNKRRALREALERAGIVFVQDGFILRPHPKTDGEAASPEGPD